MCNTHEGTTVLLQTVLEGNPELVNKGGDI